MSPGTAAHATVIAVDGPTEVAVGAEFVLAVVVSCPVGCNLSNVRLEVTPPGNTAAAAPPVDSPLSHTPACPASGEGSGTETGKARVDELATARCIALKAPSRAGEHVWRLFCAAHESDGCHHGASLLRVPVRIRPLETSLAVWAIPSPVVTGRPFAIKVGAKSAAGCNLMGAPIAVCDGAGVVLARGALGDTPWPGTGGLYWTELTLVAPATAGMFSWSVKFAAADLSLAHQGSSSRFSIAIVDPPEHKLTVKVVDQDAASPVANAQVRLGAYGAATGSSGVAELLVPKGSYDVDIWKPGYEAPKTTVTIDADLAVEVVIAPMPEENPDTAWQM
jgi:PEGA domain